jgi:hypothetical protein
MPHHSAGPPPAMFDRAGTSTLDEWVAGGLALTRARAS